MYYNQLTLSYQVLFDGVMVYKYGILAVKANDLAPINNQTNNQDQRNKMEGNKQNKSIRKIIQIYFVSYITLINYQCIIYIYYVIYNYLGDVVPLIKHLYMEMYLSQKQKPPPQLQPQSQPQPKPQPQAQLPKQDQKYIYIETWQEGDIIQIYLCKSRYDNSKKIKKIFKKISSQTVNLLLSYYLGLKNLYHANLLKYEDVYLDKDQLIIITEYVEGISLRKILEMKKITEDSEVSQLIQEKKILKYYVQIQSLLKYLQDKKILHCNISPSHIIINESDKPILIQFTPPYLERFLSEQVILYRIPQKLLKAQQFHNDRWSLAMILIELYFNKKITQLIKNLDDPFQDLEIVVKSIKNEQIKEILAEIVFLQKKIKQEPLQIVIVKQQININEEIKIKQTIVQSENKLEFTPEICSNETNQQIKIQDSKNFTESFIDLVNTQNQVTKQIVYETYQRCKQLADPIQSKSVEQTLKKQNTKQPHPLLILGSVLRQNNKTVHYSKKSTPFSAISFILLALQIGLQERKIKSLVDYAISQKQFNDSKNTNEMKEQIISILKQHYDTKQSNLIITEIKWYNNQKVIVEYYCPQTQNERISNNLRGGGYKVSEISTETLVDALQLSPSDLDSRGNIDFVNKFVAQTQTRGGLPYFQPNGWVRYGLNVSKYTQLDGNDKWLRMDGNDKEWAVYFHGLGNRIDGEQVKKNVKNIVQTQFKVGFGQFHENKKLFVPKALYKRLSKNPKALEQYKKQKQVGRGIYGSPLINQVCLQFTTGTQFENQQYRVAFQCRIHPEKVYISDDEKSYWIIREPKYIRPYGLLIGKLSDIEKQKNITNQFFKKYKQFQQTGVPF